MRLFNTLTRQKEELTVRDGRVRMYACGPTVYNYIHIGNARCFVLFDLLRRYLEYRGNEVVFVQNFTDVDDKMIAKAKAVNMPNDNIKRTIDKALGAGNTENFEAVTYEGYGPGGVAVIVDALTDNRQRTAPEVRHAFDKCNGNLGAQGCVSWSFDRKGVIVIDNCLLYTSPSPRDS